jgi:predicted O-methyltransferase YrrM
MTVAAEAGFEDAFAEVADVEGWLTQAQARVLWDRASELRPPAELVEIGSYHGRSTVVFGRAAADGVSVVAIDPHAGNDRGPQKIHGTSDEGEADHRIFLGNLERTGVTGSVRHIRRFSQEAFSEVPGRVDLLFVDGAHRYGPARDDLARWGARVSPGGVMLVHDSFSSIGVTLALMRRLFGSGGWRYVGRTGSLAEYRREPVRGMARLRNFGRQAAELPWFARNVVVKVALVLGLKPIARLLRSPDWPY